MKGKVVLFERPDPATVDRAKSNQVIGGYFRFLDRLADEQAALVLDHRSEVEERLGRGPGRLIDPEQGEAPGIEPPTPGVRIPVLTIHDPEPDLSPRRPAGRRDGGQFLVDGARSGREGGQAPQRGRPAAGSDPKLRETYVLVTAHYDHLGLWPTLEGDKVLQRGQ